jgi:poly-gamma-glutamate capsule biosynthesis protein CapA/YwtB (metallophosphatase superfamily)
MNELRDGKLVLLGCGDVGPIHEPMEAFSTLIRSTLAAADVRIGQCERVYSERGSLQVHSGGGHSRVSPQMASVFSDCGFDIVSLASNHAMDWGEDALMDTAAALQQRGIQVIGAGRNLAEARQPAIIERNGIRVAILAYCSVLREGYAAGPAKAGVAPLRAHTYYEPMEYQPGTPPRVITVPYEEDLEGMLEDIKEARKQVDMVALWLHWGIHFIPRSIADYQRTIAKAAFDGGADLILGHHAHVPKAIEVMDGKACFYSLSNFIMSAPASPASSQRSLHFVKRYGIELDPDYPRLPYGIDSKRSLIAKAEVSRGGVDRVSFLPLLIDKELRPEPLRNGDSRFDEAVHYMEWASEGFQHTFTIQGDEVVVS